MKRLVIKTALLTLVAIIVAAVITFFALFMVSPKTLGDISDGFGNYSVAVYFYEKQFNKTGNIEDLSVLVDKLDNESDSEKTQKYTEKLIFHKNFNEFCKEKDKKVGMTTAEFYYSKLAVSTYYNNGIIAAIDSCLNSVDALGYTDFNAFRSLNVAVNLTDSEKAEIKSALEGLTLSGNAKIFRDRDIEIFTI